MPESGSQKEEAVISVWDALKISNISRDNDKAYKKLSDIAKGMSEKRIVLDFKGINLVQPWLNNGFKSMINNKRIYIRVYTSKEKCDTINMQYRLMGMEEHCENIDIIDHALTAGEKEIIRKKGLIRDNMSLRNGKTGTFVYIDIPKIMSQMGDISTIDAVKAAIKDYVAETGIKDFIMDTGMIPVQRNIMKLIALAETELADEGINLDTESQNKDVQGTIGMHKKIRAGKTITQSERLMILNECIPPNTVGMLTVYRHTRRKDEFGREGDGEPVICRPAIYRGFRRNRGNIELKFETFKIDTFMTRRQYMLDHDGQQLRCLEKEIKIVDIKQIGICDRFVGSRYHFNLPIQYDEEKYVTYKMDTSRVVVVEKLLPQFIKMVLDDHCIDYNSIMMMNSISANIQYFKDIEKEKKKQEDINAVRNETKA